MKETIIILSIVILLLILMIIGLVYLLFKNKVININVNKDEKNIEVNNLEVKEEIKPIEIKEENIDDEQIEDVIEEEKIIKVVFDPTKINLEEIQLSEDPISLNDLLFEVNKLVDRKHYKSAASITLTNWLVKKGLILKHRIPIVQEVVRYSASTTGEEIGIICDDQIDKKSGEVLPSYLLSKEAQKYIIDNLTNIYSKDSKNENEEENDNVGARWTIEEEEQLKDEYVNRHLKVSEIAKIHNRKTGGIRARLKRLGLIE